jgi:hypothetical protein
MDFNALLVETQQYVGKKEDEVTWSKINALFEKIVQSLCTQDECRRLLTKFESLLIRSLLSERSRLSGTAISLLKRVLLILGCEFPRPERYLEPLIKLCGRSNRVFSLRGLGALAEMSKYVPYSKCMPFYREHSNSLSKSVRLSVFKSIESFLAHKADIKEDQRKELLRFVVKGAGDANSEVRELCRRINGVYSIKDDTSSKNVAPPSKLPIDSSKVLDKTVLTKPPSRLTFNLVKEVPKKVKSAFRPIRCENSPVSKHFKQGAVSSSFKVGLSASKLNKEKERDGIIPDQVVGRGNVTSNKLLDHSPVELKKVMRKR